MNLFSNLATYSAAFLVSLASVCAAQLASAQAFPNRTVTIVVPYPAGGGVDAVARSLGQALSRHWAQSVVVANVPGADGVIGTQRVLRAPADGYTMAMSVNQILLWKASMPDAKIEVLKDFRLVTKIVDTPLALGVSSKFPGSNIKEFIAHCQSPQQSCSWGSGTLYSQMIGKQLMDVIGLKSIVRVPYNGTAPLMIDVIGGHVTVGLAPVATQFPHVKNGTLKVFAVLTRDRAGSMPQVPTMEQEGYPVYGTGWTGLMVSRSTPPPIFDAIASAVKAVSANESLRSSIAASGGQAIFNTPEAFEMEVQGEIDYLAPILTKYPPLNK